ncbi:hypothetical protein WKH82_17460 [Acinetobacter baumannii]|nr:hypothetical protein [Acinetobacter baumannii]
MNKFEEIMLYLSDAKIELVAGQIDENVTTFDVNFKRCKNTKGKKLVRHIDKLISRCNDALIKYGLNRVHSAVYNVFQTQLENPFELEMNIDHEENDYCCYVELLIKNHGFYFEKLNEAANRDDICGIAYVNFKIKRSVDGSIKLYVQTDFATEGTSSRQFMVNKEQELVCEIDALIAALYCVKLYAQGLDQQHSNDQFDVRAVMREALEKKEREPQ